MGAITNRRSIMTLFSGPTDHWSHRVRLVLAEKGINVDITEVMADKIPEDLVDLNPYGTTPTIVDRDLVLYDSRVIIEYLDERFPHPPLMPVDPVLRAQFRLALHRIEQDWYTLLSKVENEKKKRNSDNKVINAGIRSLKESILSSVDVFKSREFFLSDDFSLVDCSIAPILWRLPYLGINLPRTANAIESYMEKVFSRESFQKALSELEIEYREDV
ncbi:MAG: stringent starvation protein A [Gammaproteobacteria bacterium TMED78]|nr:MAG: stringent starvation protein A [Gammaproteobacteria bacterium TMED78]|tara:strand:- start:2481 stop:3131 length:651 start_codon:yes stop_codon:yes gene_type:complete